MVDLDWVRRTALELPETTDNPHFKKAAFKVNKKIFATLDAGQQMLCVKLSVANQELFSARNSSTIRPVPNKWGQQGWTLVNLQQVNAPMVTALLKTAYCDVAPLKLCALIKFDE